MERPASIIRASLPAYQRRPQPLDTTPSLTANPVLYDLLGITRPTGIYVSAETAVGLAALDYGLNIVAHSVAQMLCAGKAFVGDTEVELPEIVAFPNVLQDPFEFYVQMARNLLLTGNDICVIREGQLIPVATHAVTLDLSTGFPVYRIGERVYHWQDVMHIRKDAPRGTYWGKGILSKFEPELRGLLAQQQYGITSFTTAGVPSAIIRLATKSVTEEQMTNVKDQWRERTENGREPVVLPETISVEPLSWSPQEAEFATAIAQGAAQMAYMVGLKPSDLEAAIGDGSSQLTYANLDARQEARYADTYVHVLTYIEQALSRLTPGVSIKGTFEAILRTSPRERLELRKLAQEIDADTSELEDNL